MVSVWRWGQENCISGSMQHGRRLTKKWTVRDSNPRPPRCERDALPAELTALPPISKNYNNIALSAIGNSTRQSPLFVFQGANYYTIAMNLHIGGLKLGQEPLIAGVLTDSDVSDLGTERLDSSDIIELRVDMFDSIMPGHLIEVFRSAREKFGKPIIATVRDFKEGGKKEIQDRLDIYRLVIPFADAVDVEILSGDMLKQTKDLCSDKGRLLIGSYHNFVFTPADDFLDEIVASGRQNGADVVKLGVTAKEDNDFIRLMLLTLHHRDQGIITMTMGDKGLPSRIFSPVFGSLITYGSVNKPSAPGQLSTTEMKDIFRKLKIR